MEATAGRAAHPQHGVLIGKFMPPHRGHVHLVDFARHFADHLTVIVCSQPDEPIPGALRFEWMRELFPAVRVVHLDRAMPYEPKDHPGFWALWREAILEFFPDGEERPGLLFASDDYGHRLAAELGARFIPCDLAREAVPISGEAIRADPMKHWECIAPPARPWFVRRVCIYGPESTGKSTLSRRLARHYDTVRVDEYARPFIEAQGNRCELADIAMIARGQMALEDSLARQAIRLLFCDTNLIITMMWSETLFGSVEPWIRAEADARHYDLHLLTDIDLPWVYDPQRCLPGPAERCAFFDRCRLELEQRGRRYVLLSGSMEQRFHDAVAAVDKYVIRRTS